MAASGAGTTISIGGNRTRAGQSYVQYVILGSGYGARTYSDGVTGVAADIGNCRITPVEIVETEFPVRIRRFEPARDSAGAGKYRGGLDCLREYEILHDSILTVRSGSQRVFPRWGVYGGKPGCLGRNTLNPGQPDERELPPMTGGLNVPAGTILRLSWAGAGGYGNPFERDPQAVLTDVLDRYVSLEKAREEYGVMIDPDGLQVDLLATQALRGSLGADGS